MVAPHAGAWIETTVREVRINRERSPLTQGRGLKQAKPSPSPPSRKSPLTQGRGLKHINWRKTEADAVAPHAGAWIETGPSRARTGTLPVAPHAGAWIETAKVSRHRPTHWAPLTQGRGLKRVHNRQQRQTPQVAPHAGAWIETTESHSSCCRSKSPLTQGRGLKQVEGFLRGRPDQSPLTQGRRLEVDSIFVLLPN